MKKKNLLILYTGNGKGKTTAALGQAIRAVGHGFKVCIIQFVKSNTRTGEAIALALLGDDVELHVKGSGFTWEEKDKEKLRRTSLAAWEFAREKIVIGQPVGPIEVSGLAGHAIQARQYLQQFAVDFNIG